MDTSLQNTSLTEDEMTMSAQGVQEAEHAEGEKAHIHLPNGSLWPVILGISILVTMVGFVFINTVYWITVIGAVFVFISIMGWALEDPMATHEEEVKPGEHSASFAEAASTGKPTPLQRKFYRTQKMWLIRPLPLPLAHGALIPSKCSLSARVLYFRCMERL